MSKPPWNGTSEKRVARARRASRKGADDMLRALGGFIPTPSRESVTPRKARTRGKPARLGDGVVKCLAIRDPWISLIGKGQKTIELRTRRTHYRGTVVLCSAQRRAKGRGSERFADDGPKGVALYVADLVACREADYTDTKRACTVPEYGEFAWVLSNVRALTVPASVHNWLGLFDAKPDLVKHLKKEGLL